MKRRVWLAAATSAAAVAALLVAVAVAGGGTVDAAEPRPSASTAVIADPFAAGGLQDPSAPTPPLDAGDPVVVRIPSIGVESTLESLRVGADGALSAPVDFDRAGWYVDGPSPGEIGPAIIAGHVDSVTAPAVFYRLGELKDGDQIVIDTDTGRSLSFTVTGRMQSAKVTFPAADVYSNVPRPELRLITCAGYFDRSTGHYTDNLIVFASLDS